MASALSSAPFTKKVNLVTALCPCTRWCSRRWFGGGTELLPSADVRKWPGSTPGSRAQGFLELSGL